MHITFISDTHARHLQVTTSQTTQNSTTPPDLPGGDLLIHAGDFMTSGYSRREAVAFFEWFDQIDNYDTKVFIAGNHDRIMQRESVEEHVQGLLTGYKTIDYLQDDTLELWDEEDQQVTIYGAPWQPDFYNWAFNLPRNSDQMHAVWEAIPPDTDILITHGPPYGHLDIPGGQHINVGCEVLRKRVDIIKPKIHVFGHIHGGYGYKFHNGTHFINASILNEQYQYTNGPMNVEWDHITNAIQFK